MNQRERKKQFASSSRLPQKQSRQEQSDLCGHSHGFSRYNFFVEAILVLGASSLGTQTRPALDFWPIVGTRIEYQAATSSSSYQFNSIFVSPKVVAYKKVPLFLSFSFKEKKKKKFK